ncbi:ChrR family anti-sigma-E factor [uncultured Endozoicomonas sp.]|uniref:ChrR family anti-sigma-E factor n=1 Tax=uncultured Endozoicomonas sp. TaxID=432652 RepID=UPI002638AA9A|nr:ChrR family anti-sigma-E factor [uncultured Endozoicomonas sp.]
MSCNHHPDLSTLLNYGAGSLSDALAMVVACHLESCEHCRHTVTEAENIGMALLKEVSADDMSRNARDNMLAMLDDHAIEPPQVVIETPQKEGDIPTQLRPLIGQWFADLKWSRVAPGLKQFILPASDGKLRLLNIAPGTFMPAHGHSGSELTLVLKGSYSDELGRFRAGDVADVDPDVTHQPVADTHEGCICLIATDAPLRFKGLVPRLLQPFFQL